MTVKPEEVAVFCLLYGPHPILHERLISSLKRNVPHGAWVFPWLNDVPESTYKLFEPAVSRNWQLKNVQTGKNVPKYQAMREMFAQVRLLQLQQFKWFVWFDDDSHVVADDWWEKTISFIASKESENICYFGQRWLWHWRPGQWEFVERAKWSKHLPPVIVKGKPGLMFATGAYWWLRTDVVQQLNWPDERLVHNGGDTLLGEAIRQNGLPFHNFSYGVKVNDARRRGRSDKPAGMK